MSPAAALPLPGGGATCPVAGCTDTTHNGLCAVRLGSPDSLEATFVPQGGMTCCSLRHGGVELTAERFGLGAYIDCGVTMGISIMHPWAGRLSSWSYSACGATLRLPASPLLHTDRWGLPLNGVHACGQAWMLRDRGAAAQTAWLQATLPFDRDPAALSCSPSRTDFTRARRSAATACPSTSRSRPPAPRRSPCVLATGSTSAVDPRTVPPRSSCRRGGVSPPMSGYCPRAQPTRLT